MAYDSTYGLISVSTGAGWTKLPLELINEKSYKCTNSALDLDAKRNANGELTRNVILQVPHVSFTTRALTNVGLQKLLDIFSSGYGGDTTKIKESKLHLKVFVPITGNYAETDFYMPDTEITIASIRDNVINYEPVTFEFIGYK